MKARKLGLQGLAIVAAIGLLGLPGCKEESVGPNTAEIGAERDKLAARLKKKRDKKAGKHGGHGKGAAPKTRTAARRDTQTTVVPGFGVIEAGFVYDGSGKRDPFRSFEWERPDRRDDSDIRGPLEQYDVNQLSLVAVVWNVGSARALVRDPSGQSYIIRKGTKIGKNAGFVIDIDDSVVVVKETYVDFLGQETTKDIEMRIPTSQGG